MRTAIYDPAPLIEARKQKFRTQQAFAAALNRKREIVRRLERGKQTSYETLRDACVLLDLDFHVEIGTSEISCKISQKFASNAT